MENIREYLGRKILMADGATGTYLSSLAGRNMSSCELLNLENPELVLDVHRQYVASGSKMITTNTFSANPFSLRRERKDVEAILRAGVALARKAADGLAYVAADFGPIPDGEWDAERVEEEYRFAADVFLSEGLDIFLFETFSSSEFPVKLAGYLKRKHPGAFVIADFAVLPDGNSRLNIKGENLIDDVRRCGSVDAAGFNCSSGPAHLLRYASAIDFGGLIPVLMPNAGYPELKNDMYRFSGSPEYFASKICEAASLGFKILGGCCGTTPEHIRRSCECLSGTPGPRRVPAHVSAASRSVPAPRGTLFENPHGKKIVLAELDPPFDSKIENLESSALLLRQAGADAVTISDSPLSRPRADSVSVASRLRRIAGMEAIPHICCRDKNLNALKSSILAAYLEGLRYFLAVTGDPVPEADRGSVKGVFNLNSAGLCGFIRDLNADLFADEPVIYGCAFNCNALNIRQELHRLCKKKEAGAAFVLTQPVYSQKSMDALREAKEFGLCLIAGILPPVSYRNALFLANEIPGIVLPQPMIGRFSPRMSRNEGEETGISMAVELAESVSGIVDGYYLITPFNRTAVTVEVIRRLKEKEIL